MTAEEVRSTPSAEQQLSDIEDRLLQAKIDVLHGRRTASPMWDDVIFLIDHVKGWRNLADSWARQNDKLREWMASRSEHRAEAVRLREALLEVERTCPCGARPESPNTHPHVTGCPVGRALHSDGGTDA